MKPCKHMAYRPRRMGRANYRCGNCGEDISLMLMFLHLSITPQKGKTK